jgi:hypothetical protein
MSTGNYTASSSIYGPRADDIWSSPADAHNGLTVHITPYFYLLFGDKRFEGNPERGYGTLTEQADAARKLASVLSDIAAELEQRIAHEVAQRALAAERAQSTRPAPQEVTGGTHLDNSTEECPAMAITRRGFGRVRCTLNSGHEGDHEARGAGDPPPAWPEGGAIDWPAQEAREGHVTTPAEHADHAARLERARLAACPAVNDSNGQRCILVAGHPQDHEDGPGNNWPVEHFTPETAPTTVEQDAEKLAEVR